MTLLEQWEEQRERARWRLRELAESMIDPAVLRARTEQAQAGAVALELIYVSLKNSAPVDVTVLLAAAGVSPALADVLQIVGMKKRKGRQRKPSNVLPFTRPKPRREDP